jgi:hypothetical protein
MFRPGTEGDTMERTMEEIKEALREVIQEEIGARTCDMAPKWEGGKLVFQPFDTSLQSKEVPVGVFFKKITSVREKLRVLEQKVNNHPTLSLEDRTEMQQLITRAYGTLTTFNFLFRNEDDRFTGMKE